MKNKVEGLIIVEGQSDIDFLASFIDGEFYKVNGSAINDGDIKYLLKRAVNTKLIILTDPDFPGIQIRNKINEKIPGCFNAYVRKEVSIKKHKVGVAESTKEEVLKGLENCKTFNKSFKKGSLVMGDLYKLGLVGNENSKLLRLKVCDLLGIGFSNGKVLLNKINSLCIKLEELKEVIKDVNN